MVLDDGARIDRGRLVAPRVEGEIAFRLGAPLEGPSVDRETALAAIAEIAPALEVVDSRVADWKIKLADTVADNASSGLAVLGPFRPWGRRTSRQWRWSWSSRAPTAPRREPRDRGRRCSATRRGARVARARARPVRGGHRRGRGRHPGCHGQGADRAGRRPGHRRFTDLGEISASFVDGAGA
jgi:hypothetical protein